ncbi:hypothetical protein OQA88_2832 [Cercophora sp. LCS_1]
MPRQPRSTASPDPAKALTPAASATSTAGTSGIKKRIIPRAEKNSRSAMTATEDENRPLLDGESTNEADMAPRGWVARNQWIVLALASGCCAAFNGVFAKLTTTELTTSLSQSLARVLGLSSFEGGIEVVVRAIFFGLNLVFNGVMWALFTKALTRGNSTTQVSIINTSSNFVITAILGFAIFSEALPPLWWLGAAMLVAGNVVIGRKDEGSKDGEDQDGPAGSCGQDGQGAYRRVPSEEADANTKPDEDEDILDLELDEVRSA